MSDQPETRIARAGRCAIVGRPNVGKSTLLNSLLKQKLVIATPRPGTTRSNVLGVYVSEQPPTQIAFIDTPGMERPRNALERVLAGRASEGLLGCDVILHVTEVPRKGAPFLVHEDDARIIERIQDTDTVCVLAINKVDALRTKEALLPFIEAISERARFAAVVPISALRNDGLDTLIEEITALLPEGRLFDEDILTDRPERFFVTELIREAAMHATRQEVPRGIAVNLDGYVEEGNLVRIDATLIVDKSSHKGIVLGAQGATIKKIGIAARKEIEALIERHVMLKLWVKVIPGWTRDPDKAHQIVREAEKS